MPPLKPSRAILQSLLDSPRFGNQGSREPHKLVWVLAVLDLARSSAGWDGFVRPGPELLARFRMCFALGGIRGDRLNIASPFLHLRSSSFLEFSARPGVGEKGFASARTGRLSYLNNLVDAARIRPECLGAFADELEDLELSEAVISLLVVERTEGEKRWTTELD